MDDTFLVFQTPDVPEEDTGQVEDVPDETEGGLKKAEDEEHKETRDTVDNLRSPELSDTSSSSSSSSSSSDSEDEEKRGMKENGFTSCKMFSVHICNSCQRQIIHEEKRKEIATAKDVGNVIFIIVKFGELLF